MRKPDHQGNGKADQKIEALTVMFEQYATRVFQYFQYRCNDTATAQDLTMQVFERLLRSLPRFDEDRAPVTAWLFSIARHVVTDWQRRQYLRKFIPWDDVSQRSSLDPSPEQITIESEERIRLHRALRRLSHRERDIIGLRFSSGLTNRAIAEITGMSESNVAVILFRALRKLRLSLTEVPEPACSTGTPLREVDHE